MIAFDVQGEDLQESCAKVTQQRRLAPDSSFVVYRISRGVLIRARAEGALTCLMQAVREKRAEVPLIAN